MNNKKEFCDEKWIQNMDPLIKELEEVTVHMDQIINEKYNECFCRISECWKGESGTLYREKARETSLHLTQITKELKNTMKIRNDQE